MSLFFPPYEAAVDAFHSDGGGHKITAIRSPRKELDQFKAAFPHEKLCYAGACVELVETQDYVSVIGTKIAGDVVEWPEPE